MSLLCLFSFRYQHPLDIKSEGHFPHIFMMTGGMPRIINIWRTNGTVTATLYLQYVILLSIIIRGTLFFFLVGV